MSERDNVMHQMKPVSRSAEEGEAALAAWKENDRLKRQEFSDNVQKQREENLRKHNRQASSEENYRTIRKKAIVAWRVRLICSFVLPLLMGLVQGLLENVYESYVDFWDDWFVVGVILTIVCILFVLICIVGLILTILKCPRCKKVLCNSVFCPKCGYEVKRYCSNCGKLLKADALFCHKCGKASD